MTRAWASSLSAARLFFVPHFSVGALRSTPTARLGLQAKHLGWPLSVQRIASFSPGPSPWRRPSDAGSAGPSPSSSRRNFEIWRVESSGSRHRRSLCRRLVSTPSPSSRADHRKSELEFFARPAEKLNLPTLSKRWPNPSIRFWTTHCPQMLRIPLDLPSGSQRKCPH